MNSPYFIEYQTPGKPWQRIDCLPVATEEEAWDKMAAWERYCPSERWRWVRPLSA